MLYILQNGIRKPNRNGHIEKYWEYRHMLKYILQFLKSQSKL